jgi:signal peptidase II
MDFIKKRIIFQKKMVIVFLITIFFVILDRFLKIISLGGFTYAIIDNFLNFTFVKNYFIAFSIPISGIILNYLIFSIILILLYIFLLEKKPNTKIALFIIILGASSNLFDRIIYGYVIDYLGVKWFTVFNVADTMIVFSIFYLLFNEYRKQKIIQNIFKK